nr:CbiX/SirB N-terminal domain-containing protein [Methanothrix soehngenii]
MKDVGILVLGHGSSLPFNKELVESLAQMIGKNNSSGPVRTAYLNMNQPDIPTGLKSFQGTGVKKIIATCPHGYNALKKDYPHFGGN